MPGFQAAAAYVNADANHDMDVEISANMSADTHSNGAKFFSLPDSMNVFTDLHAPWPLAENLIGDNMLDINLDPIYNWDPTLEAQFHASSEVSGPCLSSSEGYFMGNKGGPGQGRPYENDLGLEADHAETSSMSSSCSGVTFAADNNGFELGIAHLSRLCMRLSQLSLLTKCDKAEASDPTRQSEDHDPACEDLPAIQTVFKSINSWLVDGSAKTNISLVPEPLRGTTTSGDFMHQVFSASNHPLEILRYLHVSIVASPPIPSTSCRFLLAFNQPAPNYSSSSHAQTRKRPPSDASRTSQQSSHTTIHHLVFACVTLLLNIYVDILVALQRSADALSSSRLVRNLAEPRDHIDEISREHIKLVSVVQLCSYFIKPQNKTLDMILSSQGSLRHAPSPQEHDPQQLYKHAIDEMSDLKTKVERRLQWLQESLYIVT